MVINKFIKFDEELKKLLELESSINFLPFKSMNGCIAGMR